MAAGKARHLAVGFAVAAFFCWLIVRQLDFQTFLADLSEARIGWLIAAVAVFFAGYACRIARWRAMLQRDNPTVSWATCAGPFMASIAANNVLPFRAGDILRVFAFRRRIGVGGAEVLATLVVERLLDLLVLLMLMGGALLYFKPDTMALLGLGAGALIAIAFGILLVLLFPQVFRPLVTWGVRLLGRLSPKVGNWVEGHATSVLDTAIWLSKGAVMPRLLAWSVVAWLFEGLVFYSVAQSLPAIADAMGGWLALPVGTLATLIPSTPGYAGTFDYFVIQAMTSIGNAVSAATAYALLVHAALWLPATLVGGLWLVIAAPGARRAAQDVS
ncbi:MAG: lysylphosphatidylglycerol synthetase [Maritimibacter sp.]|nr:lysylphosphatidylglycerol synthetase [Maritimibacter sp.]